ncbi:pirin family protein [uncultured Pseudoteredinibacter sp.]|uniref:pirin family protein n=1 Tax=uncultured Pseudoteredinibacter sp. TaxID=1641701 RepID=UPI002612A2B7|nr:pirin family protein [uncultured Pseudoteredinibacter sp.]
MRYIRRGSQRGTANYGWLKSRHSFSFANYYDPKFMGFSYLRVLNDDLVIAGAGFGAHGHQDMEILSYVVEGAMEHRDSEGNSFILPAGDIQLMSAGRGIRHSEYNHSQKERLRFLQIWIEPNSLGGQPTYQQKSLQQHLTEELLLSPSGQDGSLKVKQDVELKMLRLKTGEKWSHQTAGRAYYVHLIAGSASLAGEFLKAGDAIAISDEGFSLEAINKPCQALLFDLPIP